MLKSRNCLQAAVINAFIFLATSSLVDRLGLHHHPATSASTRLTTPPVTQAAAPESIYQEDGGPTRVFVIETEEQGRAMAALHATGNNELMFTTYTFTHKGQYNKGAINPARHLAENLRELNLLQHAIIITYDLHSCQVMTEHGIPCFLDRWMPQPSDLPGQYGTETPHWYQKYAWALNFINWGYVTTFIEADMIFFQNPFQFYKPFNDLEGLSDWRSEEIPSAKARMQEPCNVYHSQKGENNDNYLEWGPHRPEDPNSHYHVNPCMSTGFWFIQPTKPAREFLEGFIDLELHWRNWQTDQRLWNEVIMAYLIGQGNHRPLVFSLLDVQRFSNFEVHRWRTEHGFPTSPVMLHGGAMTGEEKEPYMREHGYWRAEAWNKTGAAAHTEMLLQHFNRTLPKFGRDHLGELT